MQTQTATKPSYKFPVQLQPLFTKSGVEVPRTRAVVRTDTDTPLSVVSNRYQLYTHEQVMDAVQPFVKELGAAETQYYLEKGGARLIATHTFRGHQIRLPKAHGTVDRAVGDVIALQVHVINSYNRSTSLEFRLGGLVLRCLNGMTMFSELFQLRYAHLPETWNGVLPKPDIVLKAFEKSQVQLEKWSETPITSKERDHVIKTGIELQLLPKRYYEKELVRFSGAETIWDLYNCFTYVVTHSSTRTQQSGKLARTDRLNALFAHQFES